MSILVENSSYCREILTLEEVHVLLLVDFDNSCRIIVGRILEVTVRDCLM